MRTRLLAFLLLIAGTAFSQDTTLRLKRKDFRRDVLLQTTAGNIVLRLNDQTPLHRDNFLRLVKTGFYDSVLFHRVIQHFMIQAGDPNSIRAEARKALGNGGPKYTIAAEFQPHLFHKRGAVAAARLGDAQNPGRRSSGSQFYIVQGRTFTDAGLDSVEQVRLRGYKLPPAHRDVYKTVGGTPQLDQNYTVFGEVVQGMDVVDRIAASATSTGPDRDRPLQDVRIIKASLVKRKR